MTVEDCRWEGFPLNNRIISSSFHGTVINLRFAKYLAVTEELYSTDTSTSCYIELVAAVMGVLAATDKSVWILAKDFNGNGGHK